MINEPGLVAVDGSSTSITNKSASASITLGGTTINLEVPENAVMFYMYSGSKRYTINVIRNGAQVSLMLDLTSEIVVGCNYYNFEPVREKQKVKAGDKWYHKFTKKRL